ncbi:isopropylmalate isomerase [Roseovarius arcticus]|uniref:isopropylmalate isomerase n=1 Tax=Roseovarius arcticus TaxID=2547404 RepID=UPI001BB0F373|nr:isopropylmalate isomerase [Roseovarius arcticus]
MSFNDLADCVFSRWSPQIGDPTIVGWLTVASYFIVSVISVLVFLRQSGRSRMFWLFLSALLFALAINKQLDLQSALTAVGRCLSQAQGWYAERRTFQLSFIISIIIASVLIAVLLFWAMRRELKHIWLALTGTALLLAFIAIRAVGFHHFDQFIGYEVGSIRVNWAFEIGGIAMIGANGLYLLLRRSSDEKTVGGANSNLGSKPPSRL